MVKSGVKAANDGRVNLHILFEEPSLVQDITNEPVNDQRAKCARMRYRFAV
jgi:hypothetical protein